MLALDDIDVLSLENGISAPLCTRLLGDFGANVVKIERPDIGDVNRHWDSSVKGESSAHVWVDRNKRSIELNLKKEKGVSIFKELAEKADVIVQNFSPGVVESMDLGYSDIKAINEDIIYLNISGYGRSGPYSGRKAYDLVMQGEAGLILLNGTQEDPAKIPLSICDINAAMYGALAIVTALYNRRESGEGMEIDMSMFGGILSWLGYFPLRYWYDNDLPKRVGLRHHLITPYGPHETSDGQYINFAVLSEHHWDSFCKYVIEKPELYTDERFATNERRMEHRDTFENRVDEIISNKPRDLWADRLEKAGIPWGDVNHLDDVLAHPQINHLNLIRELDTDNGPIKFIDNPVDFDKLDLRRDPMPKLGEHTDELLTDLGYSREEIENFRSEEII